MTIFGELDDIDYEAIREGVAISRHPSGRKQKRKKERPKKVKEAEEVDILRILNIIQGKRH